MNILKALSLIGLTLLCAGCAEQSKTDSNTIRVSATIYPLAYLAQEIGKEYVSVVIITPAGVEPHDFEPTPLDVKTIRQSKVFLFNGGIDSWADDIASDAAGNGVATLRMTDHVTLMQADHAEEEPHAEHDNSSFDPHIWLDPLLMQAEATVIREAFIQADPGNAQAYTDNAKVLTEKLKGLDASFTKGLQSCALKEIVVSHDAFHYLSARYGFETVAIAGLSPEEEPSAKRLAEIADIVKAKKIGYIFFESLVDPKLSDTIAKETGADTLVLHTLEGLSSEEKEKGENYNTLMEKNLENLRTAMQCP